MAQPSFAPVPLNAEVRPTMATATPELNRPKKQGLERTARRDRGVNRGTPAPGEGFALTIAARECAKLDFVHAHDRHDVELGVGLVAAKRASLMGRSPTLGDVHVAMDVFALRSVSPVDRDRTKPFRGLAHNYVGQRRLVDAVDDASLTTGDNDATSSH